MDSEAKRKTGEETGGRREGTVRIRNKGDGAGSTRLGAGLAMTSTPNGGSISVNHIAGITDVMMGGNVGRKTPGKRQHHAYGRAVPWQDPPKGESGRDPTQRGTDDLQPISAGRRGALAGRVQRCHKVQQRG